MMWTHLSLLIQLNKLLKPGNNTADNYRKMEGVWLGTQDWGIAQKPGVSHALLSRRLSRSSISRPTSGRKQPRPTLSPPSPPPAAEGSPTILPWGNWQRLGSTLHPTEPSFHTATYQLRAAWGITSIPTDSTSRIKWELQWYQMEKTDQSRNARALRTKFSLEPQPTTVGQDVLYPNRVNACWSRRFKWDSKSPNIMSKLFRLQL